MDGRRVKSLVAICGVLFAGTAVFASIPHQPLFFDPEMYFSETEDTDLDPGLIPNSAIATSDHCARLASMEEEFERGISPGELERIQGPGPDRMPLGVSGKFKLAVANVSDPFAVTITAIDSELGNVTSPASALPRGAAGFGQRFGIAIAGEASSEFFSTFLISSIFRQDPHYHRNPEADTKARVGRALSYVVITRSDSGRAMFNFAEFLGTASSSALEGSFHPEWKKGAGAGASRIFVSIGSDAAWNLMTEFLPDVARHVNPRLLLLRRLAEKAAAQN